MSASDESNAGSGMDDVRDAAFLSVGRGVAYAGFAILTLMLSLSFDPVMALKSGGVLQLLLFAGLMLKAQRIQARDYRHTETWSLLDRLSKASPAASSSTPYARPATASPAGPPAPPSPPGSPRSCCG